ncbi:MAG: HNH endonuclease [Gammaproteobacteria bacterium]
MVGRKNWDRDELLVAFGLYCQMPFGKMHSRNPEIVRVAEYLGRTPSSLAMKLTNIASLDPTITSTGRKGLSGASSADRQMWQEMTGNWQVFAVESSRALNQLLPEQEASPSIDNESYIGRTKEVTTNARIGQNFFRGSVLSAYDNKCCISGLSVPQLLVASHIVPWREDSENRLNPSNGLCLSMLHDKAFDIGLIAIQQDMTILVSEQNIMSDAFYETAIKSYEGRKIRYPNKFHPNLDFLEYHRNTIFRA